MFRHISSSSLLRNFTSSKVGQSMRTFNVKSKDYKSITIPKSYFSTKSFRLYSTETNTSKSSTSSSFENRAAWGPDKVNEFLKTFATKFNLNEQEKSQLFDGFKASTGKDLFGDLEHLKKHTKSERVASKLYSELGGLTPTKFADAYARTLGPVGFATIVCAGVLVWHYYYSVKPQLNEPPKNIPNVDNKKPLNVDNKKPPNVDNKNTPNVDTKNTPNVDNKKH